MAEDPLDDEAIERYARQIVIPGIGAQGQRRLLRASVLVLGHPRGSEQAALYLRASGLRVLRRFDEGLADLVVVAETSCLEEEDRRRVLTLGIPVCWYGLDEAGYRSGIHADSAAPLPERNAPSGWLALHDAAACDAAALACAAVLDLPRQASPCRFETGLS